MRYELTEIGLNAAAEFWDAHSELTHVETPHRFSEFCWALEQTGSAEIASSHSVTVNPVVYDLPQNTEPSLRHRVDLGAL